MSRVISAVYENGLLRPLAPLPFREKETLRLQVISNKDDEAEEVIQLLVDAGLMPPQALSKPDPNPVSAVSFLLSIAGQGMSNEDDVSERDEEILAAEVDPIRGFHLKREDNDPT